MGYRFHMVVVLLAMVCPVFSDTCPPAEDISPCLCPEEYGGGYLICKNVDISLTDLRKVLYTFDKTIALHVQLEGMKLGTIPSDFFDGFNIKELDIRDCELDSLTEEGGLALSGLVYTLTNLKIDSSFPQRQTKLDLSHLHRFTTLFLKYNNIPEIGDDWFANGPSQLKILAFLYNGIHKLGDRAFSNLPNLNIIIIEGDSLDQMKRSMFPNPATYLKTLILNNNSITNLPEDFFTEMPALKWVYLKGNKITEILQGTFQPILNNLDIVIDLTENPLKCDDSTLQWMVKSRTDFQIRGTCQTPSSRKGMEVKDVIKSLKGR